MVIERRFETVWRSQTSSGNGSNRFFLRPTRQTREDVRGRTPAERSTGSFSGYGAVANGIGCQKSSVTIPPSTGRSSAGWIGRIHKDMGAAGARV